MSASITDLSVESNAEPAGVSRDVLRRARIYSYSPVDRASFVWEHSLDVYGATPSDEEITTFAAQLGYAPPCELFWAEIRRRAAEPPYEPASPVDPYRRFTEAELKNMTRALASRAQSASRRWVCGHGQLHQHRRAGTRYRCLFVFCHLWKCARCAPWLKRRWASHAAAKIRSAGRVHVVACSREVWDKQYRSAEQRKRGKGGGYVRVNLPGVQDVPEVVVFTTAPIGVRIDTEAAVDLAKEMIELSPAEKRAVSSSRSWKLPKTENTGEWKRVGRVATTIDQAKAIVSEFSLSPTRDFRVDADVVAFEFDLADDIGEGTPTFDALCKALDVGVSPSAIVGAEAKVPVGV